MSIRFAEFRRGGHCDGRTMRTIGVALVAAAYTRASLSWPIFSTGRLAGRLLPSPTRRRSIVRADTRDFAMRFADGSTLLRHPLVKWFVDGWREALGPDHERHVLALLEQRMNVTADRDGSIEMTVPMLYLESIAT
jgi:hypothetical protein